MVGRVTGASHDIADKCAQDIPIAPKGDPLSHRIRRGKPWRKNKRRNSRCVGPTAWVRNSTIAKPYRLYKSRTVKGSTRVPSPVRYHPLKSTVHTSWQPLETRTARRLICGPARRLRLPRLRPQRL